MTVAGRAPGDWGEYIPLGDSRAVPTCVSLIRRADGGSGHRYPQKLAALLRLRRFGDCSCAGATSDDNLFVRNQVSHQGLRQVVLPLQGEAPSTETDLVTISIGGNDIRWHSLIGDAFSRRTSAAARFRSDTDRVRRIDAALTGLEARLKVTLADVRGRATGATVLLLGHDGYHPSPENDRARDGSSGSELALLRRATAPACGSSPSSTSRVDTTAALPARSADSGGDSWTSSTPPRHPTALGGAALAAHLAAALARTAVRP